MFELLFKYPPQAFIEGLLILPMPTWIWVILPLLVFALIYFLLGYFQVGQRDDRLTITLLRSLALTLLVFSLSRPLLEVNSLVAQPNIVAVLIDNSLSMRLPDSSGNARGDSIKQQFTSGDGELLQQLQRGFAVRMFKYGASTQAIDQAAQLGFDEGASDLEQALETVREQLQGEPLAGMVVISDGATGTTEKLDRGLLQLRAAGIPLHAIALGSESYERDIELEGIRLPTEVLRGSRVLAELGIRQQGYDGQAVDLVIEDDSRILHQQELRLQPGAQTLQIPLVIEENGARRLKFHLTAMADEQISANNTQYATTSVRDRKIRILHFEGEPRFELKFIRRALADDTDLHLSGLIRTADAKFYRVGIESEQDLRHGFPITRDELFAYDALILGSVEISLLSREQRQMIVEFVSERGDGLLLLGGRHAFSEGGYHDTLLEPLSPVVMDRVAQPDFSRQVKIEPTRAAWEHPALMLADDNLKSIARWQSLPPLSIVNPIRQTKPGAKLLLTGSLKPQDEPYVVMASQRYGRGKVIAFAVQNSWLWQMHQDIEIEDQTHELLWRQLMRWLVEDVPPRLTLTLSRQEIHSGGRIRLRSQAMNNEFEAVEDASIRLTLIRPDGSEQSHNMLPHPSLPGIYETEIAPQMSGDYLLRSEISDEGNLISSEPRSLRVSAAGAEYHRSQRNERLLRRVADTTGGKLFDLDDGDGLVAALEREQQRSKVLTRLELWDMPIIFILLVLTLVADWSYRRWRNLI